MDEWLVAHRPSSNSPTQQGSTHVNENPQQVLHLQAQHANPTLAGSIL